MGGKSRCVCTGGGYCLRGQGGRALRPCGESCPSGAPSSDDAAPLLRRAQKNDSSHSVTPQGCPATRLFCPTAASILFWDFDGPFGHRSNLAPRWACHGSALLPILIYDMRKNSIVNYRFRDSAIRYPPRYPKAEKAYASRRKPLLSLMSREGLEPSTT